MIKAVIWDMDGVLIESEPYHIKAVIEIVKEHGVDLTPEVARGYVGLRIEEYLKAVARHYGADLPIDRLAKAHTRVLEKYHMQCPLVPHVKETLSILQKAYKQGLATSAKKKLAEVPLNRFSLLEYFDVMVFGDEVKKGKPNPEMFLTTAKKLEVEPQHIVVIEDAENGFKAAKNAGMLVIGRKAEHNKNQDFSLADYVIDDLREIPAILDKLE